MKLICLITMIIERGKASQRSILPHIFALFGRVCGADTKATILVRTRLPSVCPIKTELMLRK